MAYAFRFLITFLLFFKVIFIDPIELITSLFNSEIDSEVQHMYHLKFKITVIKHPFLHSNSIEKETVTEAMFYFYISYKKNISFILQ